VNSRRKDHSLKNDDVTLVVIEIGKATA